MADVSFDSAYPNFRPNVHKDAVGKTQDATAFTAEFDLRYHNNCRDSVKYPFVDQSVQSDLVPILLNQSMRSVGRHFADGKELQAAVAAPGGKAELEYVVNAALRPMLDNFCITVDNVELRRLTTVDK